MTYIENIVVGALLAIFTAVIGILLGSRGKLTRDEFEQHRASESPHVACPVHKQQLDEVEKKLDRIEEKVDRLLESR